jgi:hypothetical protein
MRQLHTRLSNGTDSIGWQVHMYILAVGLSIFLTAPKLLQASGLNALATLLQVSSWHTAVRSKRSA